MQPNTVLLDNALATMGAGLPAATMASILNPQQRVMAICCDGGFMMNSQEMETAVRLGLNLVVLVLRDNSYGMIRWKQLVGGLHLVEVPVDYSENKRVLIGSLPGDFRRGRSLHFNIVFVLGGWLKFPHRTESVRCPEKECFQIINPSPRRVLLGRVGREATGI